MRKNKLIKASGAIHISHKITLLQLKIWNILLANAYSELKTKNTFTIPIKEISNSLDFCSNDRKLIKKTISDLTKKVKFNLLGKDKKQKWGTFKLLEKVVIKRYDCTYKYDQTLQKLLYKTDVFSKIDLDIQKKFKSKYSLFLYELAVDYKKSHGTPLIEIKTFREYMGLEKTKYKTFKLLHQHVIKKAIDEINEVSDLTIASILERLDKKVVAIRLMIASS